MLLLKTLLAAASLSTALGSPVLPSLGRSDELAFPPAGVARSQAVLTTTERQTEAEAADQGRKMLEELGVGTLATTFPSDRDDALAGSPFAMMEYQVPHPRDPSSLLLILMPISQSTRNILADPSQRASFEVQNAEGRMSDARLSLIGHITVERNLTAADHLLYAQHYLKRHPDAAFWLPSNTASPHTAWWATLVPDAVFHVGGFGDTKHIGFIDLDLWRRGGEE